MNEFQSYLSEKVVVEMAGKQVLPGKLIDAGTDLLVLLHQQRYFYIPMAHVLSVKADLMSGNENDNNVSGTPVLQVNQITFSNMLQNATGFFVELYVSGHKPIHGYLSSVQTDYLIVYSPIYNFITIALDHLKWLIPYPNAYVPYANGAESMLVPAANTGSTTFEALFKKEEGNKVVLDLGSPSERIGVIKNVSNGLVDIIDVDGNSTLLQLAHIKTIYVPKMTVPNM